MAIKNIFLLYQTFNNDQLQYGKKNSNNYYLRFFYSKKMLY